MKDNSKFCSSCGKGVNPRASNDSDAVTNEPVIVKTSNTDVKTSETIIRCGNCHYEGPAIPARTTAGIVLAWLCVFFAPLITIIYFLATHKYKCPKCNSTFVGVKDANGVFASSNQSWSAVKIIIAILLGIAVIGILSSVVLASLTTARQKGIDAQVQAKKYNF